MTILGLEVSQRYEQRLWPGLAVLAKVLPLPGAGLEAIVDRELAENPALERDDDAARECPPSCGWCQAAVAPRTQNDDAEPVAAQACQWLADVRLLIGPREAQLADYVASSLDDRGLLDRSLEEIGRETGASREQVLKVVAALRTVGPPAIAASDVREALLLQLEAMGADAPELARRLVEDHMHELSIGAFTGAARALGVTRDEVVDARDFIRTWLKPPSGIEEESRPIGSSSPDVVVRELRGGELEIDVPEVRHIRVRIDPVWTRCANDASRPEDEQALALDLVSRARGFMQTLEDRRRTLGRIAEFAIHRQDRYVRGQGAPLPLTRAAVARGVGVHESTVSRAVADKVVQLVGGRTVGFASFFHASLGAEEALAELVARERRPLSDAELARELDRLGYPLARRTVTKYRSRLGIVPHTVR